MLQNNQELFTQQYEIPHFITVQSIIILTAGK